MKLLLKSSFPLLRTVLVLGVALSLVPAERVFGQTNCASPPSGLVSWWPAEGDAKDASDGNSGTLQNGVGFTNGIVGRAFGFNGAGQAVDVGNPPNLQLQNFTIEGWIRRYSTSASWDPSYTVGAVFHCAWGGYGLGLVDDGRIYLSKVGYSAVYSTMTLTDTNSFHHVAVTKSATNVVIYIDGIGESVGPYDPGFVFNGPMAIGARGMDYVATFRGAIDEMSIYNRALSTGEIQAIYSAGSLGKCRLPIPPTITSQPASQTVTVGGGVVFTVTAAGTAPLSYQWRLGGNSLPGATAPSLTLLNVQLTNAGNYSVLITNTSGSALSSNALLTVLAAPTNCAPLPSGLVSWWPAEGDANDAGDGNAGTLHGAVSFTNGMVGQAFGFNSAGPDEDVGNPTNLQLQNFTIEGWIRRYSSTSSSWDSSYSVAAIFHCAWGGYGLGLVDDGRIYLSKVGYGAVYSTMTLTDTNSFHHVAVAKSGSTVFFYIDGVGQSVGPYDPGFVFNGPMAIGARGMDYAATFRGAIDEMSIYNRALGASEVQAIFAANSAGKCVPTFPPSIVSQPTNQTVVVGGSATFMVAASGTAPLSYQWLFNGSTITNATSSALTLASVTTNQGGLYSVRVTNLYGAVVSSNALLTVTTPIAGCVTPPSGLVSWWRAEGNALDQAGTTNGTLTGNATYGPGEVGQGFVFDSNGDAVVVGNPASLQLQNFTIEGWLKRTSASIVTGDYHTLGVIFSYGAGGYGLVIFPDGTLHLTRATVDQVTAGPGITDTNLHHVAVTKTGTSVVFYIDGVGYAAPSYSTTYTFNSQAAIGAYGGDLTETFLGTIDELSIYNRALGASEIQAIYGAASAGKCVVTIAPSIITQPQRQTVSAGSNVAFSVVAAGTPPLSYQWLFKGNSITNGTNATLTLTNVTLAQAGDYSVIVSNMAGSVTSSNALLTITLPPPAVRVVSTSSAAGAAVIVPVVLVANGSENGVGFSLDFDPSLLTFQGVTAGSNALHATLMTNASQASTGKLGVAMAMPAGSTFGVGTQELIEVTFTAAVLTNGATANNSFGDIPVVRQIVDVNGNVLTATYTAGTVDIAAGSFEGDVWPRPDGDKAVTIADWVLIGRYAARLDYPTNGSEYQRADCAPRATLGDGAIKVSDWVQAGRYAAGLDPLTLAGGPTNDVTPRPVMTKQDLSPRQVKVLDTTLFQGQTTTVSVELEAQGDENGLGFSLSFDTNAFSYVGASLGSGATGASFVPNPNHAASGQIGFVMMLGAGNSFAAGSRELVKVSLRALPSAAGNYTLALGDAPVPRDVADTNAVSVNTAYVNGKVTVNPLPSLTLQESGQDIVVSWPLWATNFTLQTTAPTLGPSATWTNVTLIPVITNGQNTVTVPTSSSAQFYRLSH